MDPLYLNKNRWQESKNEYPLFGKEKKNNKKQNTARQRAKIIFHLQNGTCRKLMPYRQDPGLFLFPSV